MPHYRVRDLAANQLVLYAGKHQKGRRGTLAARINHPNTDLSAESVLNTDGTSEEEESATTNSGNPVPCTNASLTVGPKGPVLFQDWFLLDELSNFDRERIPERVVHAKGAAAFGYFEVTHDITRYTAAKVFSEIGKQTPIGVRFSQATNESGYPDTVRDVRGFAVKFYTEDGIWDLAGNNTPIFFLRDAKNFPSLFHALKRNPVSHLRDWDAIWDFFTLRPETTHQALVFFSDRGIPASYRRMHGYGSNTFSFVNKYGKFFYCKFHYKTDQGIDNLLSKPAEQIAGQDPDYLIRDLYNAIAEGNYPSWSFYVQVMSPEQAASSPYDPFDVTKVWLHADYPLIPVGRFVLNRNPKNYFAEVEQLAFNVSNLIPGISVSPDRMLQGRLFSYGDTHRYRLGVNNQQLPVNRPSEVHSYSRDGLATINNPGGTPSYHPNSFGGPDSDDRAKALAPVVPVVGNASFYDNGDQDNFTQARLLYQKVLTPVERGRLIENIVMVLKLAAEFLQERAIKKFSLVDESLGSGIRAKLQEANRSTVHADI